MRVLGLVLKDTVKPPENGHQWDQCYFLLYRGVRCMEVSSLFALYFRVKIFVLCMEVSVI